MKTTIIIEIESPDRHKVWMDDNIVTEEDAFKRFGRENVERFQKEFSKDIHDQIVDYVMEIKEKMIDDFNDGRLLGDNQLENWEDLSDFDVEIKVIKNG